MSYRPEQVFRFNGSVGVSGTNNLEDVKHLQEMIISAGYNQISGNHVRVNGQMDSNTKMAIIWYQRLLNMSPSGLVHPMETWFFNMFSKAISPHWRPRHTIGTLHVREGQFTFNAEGRDFITAVEPFKQPLNMPNFSRVLYYPGGGSGVTLGRGYDMKLRSSGEILSDIRAAGIEEYKAVICSKAAGLNGRQAAKFVRYYGPLVGEITHLQQVHLFENSFQSYIRTGQRIFNFKKNLTHSQMTWNKINARVRDIYLDSLYQGCYSASKFAFLIIKNNINDIRHYLKTDPFQVNTYGRNILRLRYISEL